MCGTQKCPVRGGRGREEGEGREERGGGGKRREGRGREEERGEGEGRGEKRRDVKGRKGDTQLQSLNVCCMHGSRAPQPIEKKDL